MSAAHPAEDLMTLRVGSTDIRGWEQVAVTVSVETCPNSFTFTAGGADLPLILPGQPCTVLAGSDVILTGFVDAVNVQLGPDQHETIVTGRGLCQDLVDCSADLLHSPAVTGGNLNASDLLDLAQKLAAAFKITVRSAVPDRSKPVKSLQVALGESPWQIIERVARWAGFLVYEDSKGALVLDRVATERMASGFSVPGNIESAQILAEIDSRYSEIAVVWNAIASLSDLSPTVNQRAHAVDKSMPRFRKPGRGKAHQRPRRNPWRDRRCPQIGGYLSGPIPTAAIRPYAGASVPPS